MMVDAFLRCVGTLCVGTLGIEDVDVETFRF